MIRFTIFLLCISLNPKAQVKTGLYNDISDTLFIGKAWIKSYSQISLNSDNTFNYRHRTSEGCLLWYDITGTWFTKSGKVYLVDNAAMYNLSDTTSGLRTTVFKIQNDKLNYFNSFFDGDKVGFTPRRNIIGNFLYKRD